MRGAAIVLKCAWYFYEHNFVICAARLYCLDMRKYVRPFPQEMKQGYHSHEEFINSGVSPLDSLIFIRGIHRASIKAHQTDNILWGQELWHRQHSMHYTEAQAEAALLADPTREIVTSVTGHIALLGVTSPEHPDIPYYQSLLARLEDSFPPEAPDSLLSGN